MEILSIRAFQGPNLYSYSPVLLVKIDIGRYEETPSSEIDGFNNRLTGMLPSLFEHHCSRGYPGGFVERLREGTYLAHIFEHVVLELQHLAGYDVKFGKTRTSGKQGVYDLVVGCRQAAAAKAAVYEALELITALLEDRPFDVEAAVSAVRQAGETEQLGPSTEAIRLAAKARDIPVQIYGKENLLVLGQGCYREKAWATLTGRTSAVAADLVSDKQLTKTILEENGIIVPKGWVVTSAEQAVRVWSAAGIPVVVKPLTGNQGKGVTINITKRAELERAFREARVYDEEVLVEEYISGLQYRFCVVNGTLAATAERIPAYVVGDGIHSVAELVRLANEDPARGEGHTRPLSKIRIDAVAVMVLAKQHLTPQAVPAARQVVRIRDNANLSTGGTAVDVTDIVHPANVRLAERAALVTGLDVAGIDIVAKDITQPIRAGNGALIEVNAAPGIRMHHYPSAGKPRDVAGRIVDYLFPRHAAGRIPLIAVTGTNGKTTVTRMIGHIWKQAGFCVGMTTTDGIYINDECVMDGDTTGPDSAKIVLNDPRVEAAVLETARGGIIRGGLAFDKSDVGIVTNITEDHIGQDGIENLSDLAYIKSLILETVKTGGFALLNADDPCVAELAARVRAEIVYFSVESSNIIVRRHLGAGGKAFFVKDGVVYGACGGTEQAVIPARDIPVTFGGIAVHNLQNAVIAAAASFCMRIPMIHIRQGLAGFEQNPGRMNLIHAGNFRICIDYGHNPAGYQALINTVKRMEAQRLVGVIAAPGDRRDDVTVNIGRIAGRGFDYIYIKEDADLRGRKSGETASLLRKGVLESGFSPDKVSVVLREEEAVKTALNKARSGDLIVIFYEKYDTVMTVINQLQEKLKSGGTRPAYEQVVVAGAKMV